MEKNPGNKASSAGQQRGDRDARQRIAELEQQVAQLQGQLQDADMDRASGADAASASHDLAAGDSSSPMIVISRFKMILVGVITSLLILTLILTIFSFLSKGFDSAARRAAEVISPQPEGQPEAHQEPGDSNERADQDEDEALVRPPGL